MYSHLVSIKVSVVPCTNTRMNTDCCSFDEDWVKGLHTKLVKRWSTVKEYRVILGDLFENIENLRRFAFNKVFGTLDIWCKPLGNNFPEHKRFEHFESHFFWQPTLIESQFRTNDDDGSTRIVHTFSKKVLSETALFS